MFKNLLLVSGVLFALTGALPALAETAPAAAAPAASTTNFPAAVIAVVDIERIMKESAAGKNVRDQLATRRTSYQQQVTADEAKLREAEQALVAQRATLTAEQFDVKRREFETQARAAQQRVQERARVLDTAFGEALGTIKQNVAQIVAELAKGRGVTVVLDKSQVIVVESSLDFTASVLTQLNTKLPRLEVRVPAAAAPRAQAQGR